MNILVCGGRDFTDWDVVRRALDPYLDAIPHTLITGGARGADALAEQYATEFGWRVEVYPANWKRDGKAAGPIRNQQMLDEAAPNVVVAFPGGRGTADMVRRARAAGVEVVEVQS